MDLVRLIEAREMSLMSLVADLEDEMIKKDEKLTELKNKKKALTNTYKQSCKDIELSWIETKETKETKCEKEDQPVDVGELWSSPFAWFNPPGKPMPKFK